MLTSADSSPTLFRFRLAAALTVACCVVLVGVKPVGSAPANPHVEIPEAVDGYSSAVDDLLTSKGKQPIEPVFENGMKAAPQVQAVLPELTEAQFQQVQHQMQGFIVVRHDAIIVRPSVDYFKNLSRKSGTKADRAFFDIYQRTEPDGNGPFPAYVQQQTDQTGCTRFDGKLMVDLYRGWLTFRTTYPDAYAPEAQGEIDSIETELLSGICTCGNAEQTAANLTAFINAFPDLPITPKIKNRIAEIRSGTSKFRFNCRG